MKILIMEDEAQIREGLAEEICWPDYGITEVFTAKNGEIGFELARKYRPEIILTDIRMPRLDGISAVKKLRQILPDCSIIFISAYPEKNYFKEAIRLKAVSFVEKPINMGELEQTLGEAVREQGRNRLLREQKEQACLYHGQKLADRLNRNLFQDREECSRELAKVGIQVNAYTLFSTMLLRYAKGMDKEDENRWMHFCLKNEGAVQSAPSKILWSQKQPELLVYHVFMKDERELGRTLEWMKKQLDGVNRWYLLVGSVQGSPVMLKNSYNDAVLLLNQAFYLPYGTIVDKAEEGNILMTLDFGNWKAKFTERVKVGRFDEAAEILEECRGQIQGHGQIHYTTVREFYLYLYGELTRYAEHNAVLLKEQSLKTSMFFENGNYQELHDRILVLLDEIQRAGESREDEFIVHIKKYVQDNYRNPYLSIKEIADAVGRSVSYVCVMFKKETGITLNQYLTEVRLETAKALLDNHRNSIKTAAEESGYTDSSYFSRTFKKYTGQTPSEYRGEEK